MGTAKPAQSSLQDLWRGEKLVSLWCVLSVAPGIPA